MEYVRLCLLLLKPASYQKAMVKETSFKQLVTTSTPIDLYAI